MKIKARIRWKMYNSVKKRINRRFGRWDSFATTNRNTVKNWLTVTRDRDYPIFVPKIPIRKLNSIRTKHGAAPVNPTIINKMYGYRL